MKEVWTIGNAYPILRPSDVKKLLGKDPEILKEVPMKGFSRLLAYPSPESLVIVRGKHACFSAMKCASGHLFPFLGLFRADGTPYREYLEENCRRVLDESYFYDDHFIREKVLYEGIPAYDLFSLAVLTPNDLPYQGPRIKYPDKDRILRVSSPDDLRILYDLPKLEDLLWPEEPLSRLRQLESPYASLLPETLPRVPREITDNAAPDDCFGVYSMRTFWWWKQKTGDIHIIGKGAAEPFTYPDESNFFKSGTMLHDIFTQFIDLERIRDLVVHEGITSFSGVDIEDDYCFRRILLPSTLKKLGVLRCRTKWMKIPASVREMALWNLVNECGGHWDPVTFAAETLLIPSEIRFEDDLMVQEPIDFWKNVIIYGKKRIPDLRVWYDANMLNTERDSPAEYGSTPGVLLDISYPAAWDHGKKGSYAALVESFIREQKPVSAVGPYSMYTPDHYEDWTEEDYAAWHKYFHPKE